MFFLLFFGVLLYAWWNRFVQDDAFISFLYAKNAVEGRGLTWFGSYVEGYTNFLWVLWIALGLWFSQDPILWSYGGGFFAFALTFYSFWRVAPKILERDFLVFVALGLWGFNYSVSSYATGGLETMLQGGVLSFALVQFYTFQKEGTWKRAFWISLLLGITVLIRMDSVLLGGVLGLRSCFECYRQRLSFKVILALVLPVALILGAWGFWKLTYYGLFFPNTYYAKIHTDGPGLKVGSLYVWRFLQGYGLWPFFLLGGIALFRSKKTIPSELYFLGLWMGLWILYVLWVGGDFMEFRFLMVITPWIYLTLVFVLQAFQETFLPHFSKIFWGSFLLILGALSFTFPWRFQGMTEDQTLDSISALKTFYGTYPDEDWSRIGLKLKKDLSDLDITLALHAVGAIPYYSGFKTIDMWGLTDPVVAREGIPVGSQYHRPGHRRRASFSYLVQQKVHFVIGHPTLKPTGILKDHFFVNTLRPWIHEQLGASPQISQATFVAMPLEGGEQVLLLWYLTLEPKITQRLQERKWEIRTLFF